MPRSRPHDSATDPPDDGAGPPRPRTPSGGDSGSVAKAQAWTFAVLQQGRIGASRQTPATRAAEITSRHLPPTPDDLELSFWEQQHAKLGDNPPRFNVAANDAAHGSYEAHKAHTLSHHGPTIPLRRDTSRRTIEGRIYNDAEWGRAANGSFKWNDHTTMHRVINDYVQENWRRIRFDLATGGLHRGVFNAGHAVGEGFVNNGMFGAGPPQAQYAVTSTVRITIRLAPGTDPPQPYIVTAFPTGLG
jgi:hypothetical protein